MVRALGLALTTLAALCTAAYAGVAATGEIPVNTSTTGDQQDASVAMDKDGNFAVAWEDDDEGDIDGRVFGSTGTPFTAEEDTEAGGDPAIAVNPFGTQAAITYQQADDVYATLFTLGGSEPLLGTVNTETTGEQEGSEVAMDANGNFVIVWSDVNTNEVDGQRFAANGDRLGGNFTVSDDAVDPAIAMDDSGDFVVSWESEAGDAVRARAYDATATPRGPAFPVPVTQTGNPDDSDVAIDADGDFVVIWEDGATRPATSRAAASAERPSRPRRGISRVATGAGEQDSRHGGDERRRERCGRGVGRRRSGRRRGGLLSPLQRGRLAGDSRGARERDHGR